LRQKGQRQSWALKNIFGNTPGYAAHAYAHAREAAPQVKWRGSRSIGAIFLKVLKFSRVGYRLGPS